MSARPRIALRVHGGLPARECAAQARAAEEAGFSTVWFAENAFGRGAMSGLAASALATRTIRLGVGVFNPFNRHPTLIAMEMAGLDELSDGRVVLGIGSGIRLAQIGMAGPGRVAAGGEAGPHRPPVPPRETRQDRRPGVLARRGRRGRPPPAGRRAA